MNENPQIDLNIEVNELYTCEAWKNCMQERSLIYTSIAVVIRSDGNKLSLAVVHYCC